MSKGEARKGEDQGVSKVKLAIGAASLFLFIIGVKRTFRMDQHQGPAPEPPRGRKEERAERPERRGKAGRGGRGERRGS